MKVNREELLIGLLAILPIFMLNVMMIGKYDGLFNVVGDDYAKTLSYYFHVSGFDPVTYNVLTEWGMKYDVLRHPLLPFLMYPFYLLNQAVIALTGTNGAMYIAAAIILTCGFYTAVFLFRILRRLMGLERWDATLLTLFFFSFGYVMVTFFVPDHFAISLLLILLSIYLIALQTRTPVPPFSCSSSPPASR